MKMLLTVLLVTLASTAQAQILTSRCQKDLIGDVTARILEANPKAEISPRKIVISNSARPNYIQVFVPGSTSEQDLYLYYTIKDAPNCTDVYYQGFSSEAID